MLNESQIEAIAAADAYLNNVALPTYTDLKNVLEYMQSVVDAPASDNVNVPKVLQTIVTSIKI